ncbi:hypothetical protein JAAARDRAFT_47889 [Jaapia argillacea MUCL 33604]|uniref:Uncharacterized protein n=1 Tax=Jaapia argillacea MUCL 33604 TaxID=933084 RepID=A0A067PRB4_9AGAM|nr:hypothetical protein JAAARDRAFT_47889 [Jaapia argillacea MUCL 33604]
MSESPDSSLATYLMSSFGRYPSLMAPTPSPVNLVSTLGSTQSDSSRSSTPFFFSDRALSMRTESPLHTPIIDFHATSTPSFGNRAFSSYGSDSYLPNCMQIIRDATHDNLTQAGNTAYLASQAQVATWKEAYELLLRVVPQNSSEASNIMPGSHRAIPAVNSLNGPWQEEDFPQINFWTLQKYEEREVPAKDVAEGSTPNPRGNVRLKEGVNVMMKHVEDWNGIVITASIAAGLRDYIRAELRGMDELEMLPDTWGKITLLALQHFRTKIYQGYPYLQLCENHWKLHAIMTKIYPNHPRKGSAVKAEEGSEQSGSRKGKRSSALDSGSRKKSKHSPSISTPLKDEIHLESPPMPDRDASSMLSQPPIPPLFTGETRSPAPITQTSLLATTSPLPHNLSILGANQAPLVNFPSVEVNSTAPLAESEALTLARTPYLAGLTPTITLPATSIPLLSLQCSQEHESTSRPLLQLRETTSAQTSPPHPNPSHSSLDATAPLLLSPSSSRPTEIDINRNPIMEPPGENLKQTGPTAEIAPKVNISRPQFRDPLGNMFEEPLPAGPSSIISESGSGLINPEDSSAVGQPSQPELASVTQPSAPIAKKKTTKIQPSKSTTARNLFMIDYRKLHHDTTTIEFAAVWLSLDKETRDQYEALSEAAGKKAGRKGGKEQTSGE